MIASAGSKGERTRLKIIDACIQSVAKNGFENTSVSTITGISKVNRGLVVHYFSTTGQMFKEVNHIVKDYVIRYSTEYMNSHTEIEDLISRYVGATFSWLRERPHYGRYLVLLISRSHYDSTSADLIENVFSSGRQRLKTILQIGADKGIYQVKNVEDLAYRIHTLVVGHIILCLSDLSRIDHFEKLATESATQITK